MKVLQNFKIILIMIDYIRYVSCLTHSRQTFKNNYHQVCGIPADECMIPFHSHANGDYLIDDFDHDFIDQGPKIQDGGMQLAFIQPLIAEIQMEEEPYAHRYQAMNNHIPVIPPSHHQVPIDLCCMLPVLKRCGKNQYLVMRYDYDCSYNPWETEDHFAPGCVVLET